MPQLLQTFSDDPLYVRKYTLDGIKYILDWDYNGKEDRIYFDFTLLDGTVLLRGLKVVPYMALLARTSDFNRPPGELICTTPDSDDSPPGLGELGEDRRCQLWYYTLPELEQFLKDTEDLNLASL